MARAAVLMAEGFEEGETLTIVDILRRAGAECTTFSFNGEWVKGMQGMYVKADRQFDESVRDFDVLVLPGGRPGGENLRTNPAVIDMIRWFHENGKYVAAMCSGTIALSDAGIINGVHVTGYTGYAEKLKGGIFTDQVAVCDQKIITSQGPATGYPFAYLIAEQLGYDVSGLKERMLYNFARGK